ncbi:MAG: sulfide/dihydroorotate dehydrogenase-like FAD/NAD-binding protein [Tissierellia bacterium]|nr:sulfide/dihydroorotate dehydrogenase-like FAD/NAD-binding protein [Tissierellia bacterium]
MFQIVKKNPLATNIFSMDIKAPRVALSAKPGQFVILIADEKGERIPLTISDFNKEEGTVQVVIQSTGPSTKKLALFEEGDMLQDFVGPLGNPSNFIYEDIETLRNKNFIFVAGGVGAAPVYPQVKWLHSHGIDVDVIVGSKTKDSLILTEKLKSVSKNLYITTDDGTFGFHGMVTACLEDLIENKGKKYDQCVAIGPMIMMKFTCLTTEKYNLPTTVSLNPIMVDGTGMCGACRCTVNGKTKFACVQGPEFDGHLVDFDEAMKRQMQYKDVEKTKGYCQLNDKVEVAR